jgi:hypothetical protein
MEEPKENQKKPILSRLLPKVKKHNDKIEEFDPYKIILFIVNQYELKEDLAKDIAQKIIRNIIKEKKDIIHSYLLRELIETELIERKIISLKLPLVITSKGDEETFEDERIIKSLVNETYINQKIANNLTKFLKNRLRRSKITFLSSPLIREMMCSVLIENGREDERKLYTRLGNPRADIEDLFQLLSDIDEKSGKTIFQLQIKQLMDLGLFNSNSVGKLLYEQLKEFFALRNWEFMIIWKIQRFLKKFRRCLNDYKK